MSHANLQFKILTQTQEWHARHSFKISCLQASPFWPTNWEMRKHTQNRWVLKSCLNLMMRKNRRVKVQHGNFHPRPPYNRRSMNFHSLSGYKRLSRWQLAIHFTRWSEVTKRIDRSSSNVQVRSLSLFQDRKKILSHFPFHHCVIMLTEYYRLYMQAV